MKQYKAPQKSWGQTPKKESKPSNLRQEIDAAIRGITETVKKDPKMVARALESWVNLKQSTSKTTPKKKAA